MANDEKGFTLRTLTVSIVMPLVVVLVAGWYAAEAARQESLRSERRSAYSELLAAIQDCQRVILDADSAQFQQEVTRAEGIAVEVIEDLDAREADCRLRLDTAVARVRLVSDQSSLTASAEAVSNTILALPVSRVMREDDESLFAGLTAINDARGEFEVHSRRSANSPAPLVPRSFVVFILIPLASVLLPLVALLLLRRGWIILWRSK